MGFDRRRTCVFLTTIPSILALVVRLFLHHSLAKIDFGSSKNLLRVQWPQLKFNKIRSVRAKKKFPVISLRRWIIYVVHPTAAVAHKSRSLQASRNTTTTVCCRKHPARSNLTHTS